MASEDDRWIEHRYTYTYSIANRVAAAAHNCSAHELEGLMLDGGILEFVPPWQKDTALHKFIRYIAEDYLIAMNTAKRLVSICDSFGDSKFTLPIEIALVMHGVKDDFDFVLTEIPRVRMKRGSINYLEPASEVQEACDRHLDELRLTGQVELLLEKLADEVFFVMFTNRAMLQALHECLSSYLQAEELDWIEEEYPDLARYFRKVGVLNRSDVPEWARTAVYHRDRGTCANCHRDLTKLVSVFSKGHYDHIVPLARGGLNDVTNLQLLCADCNQGKSDAPQRVSISYERWFR